MRLDKTKILIIISMMINFKMIKEDLIIMAIMINFKMKIIMKINKIMMMMIKWHLINNNFLSNYIKPKPNLKIFLSHQIIKKINSFKIIVQICKIEITIKIIINIIIHNHKVCHRDLHLKINNNNIKIILEKITNHNFKILKNKWWIEINKIKVYKNLNMNMT